MVDVINHDFKYITDEKLTEPQTQYTVTENKLLSKVKTLKGFCIILLGQEIKIYTDHKTLTCKNFNNNHILLCRLILYEYSQDIEYIPANKNIVADALSQLTMNGNQDITYESTYTTEIM